MNARVLCFWLLWWVLLAPACAQAPADPPAERLPKTALAGRKFHVEPDTGLVKGGVTEKYLLGDDHGTVWLFKPMRVHEAMVEEACARLATALGLTTPEVFAIRIRPGLEGSLSRLIANRGNLRKRPPESLSPMQVGQLLELQVFDWFIANFDTHNRNFLVDPEDNVLTIDHGLAFQDGDMFRFDLSAGDPYRLQSYFHDLWKAIKSGAVKADVDRVFPFVDRVAALPDAWLAEIFGPYARASRAALGNVTRNQYGEVVHRTDAEFLFALSLRKRTLRADFEQYYARMQRARGVVDWHAPPAVAAERGALVAQDPEPVQIAVADAARAFGALARLGRRIKIEVQTFKVTGAQGLFRAIVQRAEQVVARVKHAVAPLFTAGLTTGEAAGFDFRPELDARRRDAVRRAGPDARRLLRERAIYVALNTRRAAERAHANLVLVVLKLAR